jgi:2-amino-4-hydroxy-6-hydroxymethyldihydropteridine diphosphokinase
MKRIYLGLGSNLGEREENLRRARELLNAAGIRILRESSLYETEPQDLTHQPWFLNQVVEAETALFPMQLLGRVLKIEKELGRRRVIEKGPRTLDIDILLYHRFVIDSPVLVVPHPRMHERRFVLAPMAELAPDLRHPVTRQTMRELLGRIKGQAIRRFNPVS